MLKSVLTAVLFTFITSAASAESVADAYCQQWITETGRYQPGIGTVELSGPPLVFGTWSAAYSIITVTFPEQVIVLTTQNVHAGALGDYIATTVAHRNAGHEAFSVITDDADGNRLGLIQPFGDDESPNCFVSAIDLKK